MTESRKRQLYLLKQSDIFREFIPDESYEDSDVDEDVVRFSTTPSYMHGEMRDYQIQGLNWLISQYHRNINGILADEMGLGKTVQSIAFLGYLRTFCLVRDPFLVIAPKSTTNNWKTEISKWIPDMKVVVFMGNKEERDDLIRTRLDRVDFDVMVTSYEICMAEKKWINRIQWSYLVIDEAHRIKNEHSRFSVVVREISPIQRLLLTGTPLQNNIHELWALLNFLLPDVFQCPDQFQKWVDQNSGQASTRFKHLLEPFILRRIKTDVEKTLLPKQEVYVYVPMSEMQRQWYRRVLEKDVYGGILDKREARSRLMNTVMQLRKCVNHPYLFDGAEPGPPYSTGQHLVENSGKMRVLDKLLERLWEKGARVLIFTQMSRMLDILEDYCVFRGWKYCRIDGSTSGDDRVGEIEEFNRSGSDKFVFLLTTRAGGMGINLTAADTVILYDSDWNPQVDLQAQDRAHRIGQTKQVVVFRLVGENTIEEQILERAIQKLRLDQLVIQQGKMTHPQNLSSEHLLEMIRFGVQAGFGSQETDNIDIEDMIRRGEERTRLVQEKYRNADMDDLQRFTIIKSQDGDHGGWKGLRREDEPEPKRRRPLVATQNIQPVKRESRPKEVCVYDFQFFPERLQILLRKEHLHRLSRDQGDQMAPPLTETEVMEKNNLMKLGYGHWSRREYQAFIRGCEKYGRHDLERICAEIGSKSLTEVRRYAETFWNQHFKIKNSARIVAGIEKGEARIARRKEIQEKLSEFVRCESRTMCMFPPDPVFVAREDEFLVAELARIGYGTENVFEKIRRAIGGCEEFRLDWVFRTRTLSDIARRTETLVSTIVRWMDRE